MLVGPAPSTKWKEGFPKPSTNLETPKEKKGVN